MAVTDSVPNEQYEPNERQEAILALLKEHRGTGRPWGRVNPKLVTEETGMRRQYASRELGDLVTAGWVRKRATGLYEFVADPREEPQTGD